MSWYSGTYACGCEGRTQIYGPTKNREWLAERHFEKHCPECWEKKLIVDREIANKESLEKAKEMELPELQGTEKQAAWANTLRQKLIDDCEEKSLKAEEVYASSPNLKSALEEYNSILSHILSTKTAANWYIDNRAVSQEDIFRSAKAEMEKAAIDSMPEAKAVIEEEKSIKEQSTVFPESYSTTVASEITVTETSVILKSEKNDSIIHIAKNLGYKWDSRFWILGVTKFNGPAEDRAAELGNKLLNAGFPITIINPIIRQNAIDGKFEPKCKRWLSLRTSGDYPGWLCISWEGDNDKLYKAAKSLPGARWSSPSVVVRVEHYKECLDFVNLFGFKVSSGAEKAIEEQKQKEESVLKVKPAKVAVPVSAPDGLKDILKSGDEILDDLKD